MTRCHPLCVTSWAFFFILFHQNIINLKKGAKFLRKEMLSQTATQTAINNVTKEKEGSLEKEAVLRGGRLKNMTFSFFINFLNFCLNGRKKTKTNKRGEGNSMHTVTFSRNILRLLSKMNSANMKVVLDFSKLGI